MPPRWQTKDKWESYLLHDRGGGLKRDRVGTSFDTAEDAAAAYAAECRRALLGDIEAQQMAAAKRVQLWQEVSSIRASASGAVYEFAAPHSEEYLVEKIINERVVRHADGAVARCHTLYDRTAPQCRLATRRD